MVDPSASNQSLKWIAENLHLIGWPVLVTFVWSCRGVIDKYMKKQEKNAQQTEETLNLARQTKAGVDTIQTNHLAHLETSMKTLSEQSGKQTEALISIDKNIGLLLDRFPRQL